ncbi:major facilitator superfamily domain-containing protein [Xylaria sp. FL1777]|nr:major facilitator superfamily domain-containing protein [Xylaria sp. FL1777]
MEGIESEQKFEGDEAQWTTSSKRDDAESQSEGTIELGPVRSQNGHGCADLSDSDDNGDPFEVSFNGDDDPMCPRNMNLARKWFLVCIVGLGSLCVTCTSSIYTATYSQMNPEFHQSEIVATLGLSTFVLGIALGPLFLGPLSEFYGRRPIYLTSWTMFVIWLIPSAVARNTATMVTVRFIDGFAGSAFLSVAGGTVSDVFRRDQIQSPMTIISLSPFIGPSLGPLIGGFINYYTNWRWTYYVLIIWAVSLLVMMVFFAPETYHPIKLREKARLLRQETGDERWKAPIEKSTKSIPKTIGLSLIRPFQLLTLEPMCLLLSLLSAVLLGVIYLFFGAFPLVFGGNFGFNLWQVGLSFLGIFVGMLIGAATNPVWHSVHRRLVRRNHGVPEPEFRLASSILGAVMVPIGLFWFAWTSWIHWILPIIGSGIFGCGTLLVFNGIFTFLVDTYPLYAASALAANSFLRCTFAAAFPLFGKQLYQAAGYPWASSVLAFITLALMPLPYVFFNYGKRLRQKSTFTVATA